MMGKDIQTSKKKDDMVIDIIKSRFRTRGIIVYKENFLL